MAFPFIISYTNICTTCSIEHEYNSNYGIEEEKVCSINLMTWAFFTRVCTFVQRESKFCVVVVVVLVVVVLVLVAANLLRIRHFRPISPCFQLLSILCHCMHVTLPGSLARKPCPEDLPGSLARQPCPATLPGSLARQPCPVALPGSLARQPCPLALPASLARQPCPPVLQKSLQAVLRP
jgi:hypothetical protein